jgi:3-deoxy-D-manno-octulosonate 8-phosphate phosphatase (KDO 8-P phosphatase)
VTLADRCRRVTALVLDVDGVLSDGGIIYTGQAVEVKRFHVRDGSALKMWQQTGMRLALLSGRTAQPTLVRAAELGIAPVVQGGPRKQPGFARLLHGWQIPAAQVAYLGDDTADVPVLRDCGLALAVADACADVRRVAHYITRTPGGHGAVREAIELILRCQGRWTEERQAEGEKGRGGAGEKGRGTIESSP